MKLSEMLVDYLAQNHIRYEVVSHKPGSTALEIAQNARIDSHKLAKTVIVRKDGEDAMAIIPADKRLDLSKLRTAAQAKNVEIEEERAFGKLFPDSEPGAMPPIGAIYHMPCYVDARLTESENIFMNAGSNEQSIRMATADYLRLSEAVVADLAAEAP